MSLDRGELTMADSRLFAFFAASSRGAQWTAGLVAAAIVALTTVAIWRAGCAPMYGYAEDSFFLLDVGWRMFSGQRPHTDFSSYLGVVALLPTWLGMLVDQPSADALARGPAVLLPLFTLWCWGIARRRLTAWHTLWATLFVGFLTVAPFSLGTTFELTTYAENYNRYGWALFCILLLEAGLAPRASGRRWIDVTDGLSTGLALALLAFLKINYFAMAVATLLAAALMFARGRARWGGILLGIVLGTLVCAALLRFDLASFVHDQLAVTGARTPGKLLDMLARQVRYDGLMLGLTLVAVLLSAPALTAGAPRWSWIPQRGLPLFVLGVDLVGLVIVTTNAQRAAVPLFAVAILIAAESCRRQLADHPPAAGPLRYVVLSLLATFALGVSLGPDAAGTAYACAWKFWKAPRVAESQRIQSPVLRDMIVPPVRTRKGDRPSLLVDEINRGLELVRAHAAAEDTVLSLRMTDFLSVADLRPSPQGTVLMWCVDYVHEGFVPDTDQLFADADWVMSYNGPNPTLEDRYLLETFGEELAQKFHQVDTNAYWTLWQKNAPAPAAP